ncbi:hypothetical protein QCA50_011195 [Cerrena zonata]|uniref:Uncharacterized protein n=1 Tax=Cerrena zonata TaxID=2478898 RepID=A0AAW0G3G0_9APHY
MLVISAFGIAKAILTYQGLSAVPTTLDWILGVVLTIILYWVGQYEAVCPPVLPSFFHTDYAPHIVFTILEFGKVFVPCAFYAIFNIFVLGGTCVGVSVYLIQHASDVDKVIIIILLYGGIAAVGLSYNWLSEVKDEMEKSLPSGIKRLQNFCAKDHAINKRLQALCDILGVILGIAFAIYLMVWFVRVPVAGIRDFLVRRRESS